MRSSWSSRSGLTIVEMALAMSILVLVLGVPVMLMRSSRQFQETAMTRTEVQSRARRAVARIASRLEVSSTAIIPQAGGGPNTGTPVVDFQAVTGWNAAGAILGNAERILLADEATDPDDGVDNDGDGLVDEKRVMWIEDVGLPTQRTHELCDSVRSSLDGEQPGNAVDDNGNGLVDEPGFVLAFDGDRVEIFLTLEARNASGFTVTNTVQRTIAFRN